MSDKQHELISAFLDEELSAAEIDDLLSQLECSKTRAQACRQAQIGGLMGSNSAVLPDISASVMAAIRQESVPAPRVVPLRPKLAEPVARRAARWWVPASGLGLAASVAMAAVLVTRPEAGVVESVNAVAVAQVAQPVSAAVRSVSETQLQRTLVAANAPTRELVIAAPTQSRPIVAQWSSADGAQVESGVTLASTMSNPVQQRLNTYLINHARYGGGYALSGSLGYARVAANAPQQMGESAR